MRFFAICREIAGRESTTLELPNEANEKDFWQQVVEQFPRLAPYREHCRLAVNMEYVESVAQIHDGDEISIIPPVSGG